MSARTVRAHASIESEWLRQRSGAHSGEVENVRERLLSVISTLLVTTGMIAAIAWGERVTELKSTLAGTGAAGVLGLIALRFAWTLTTVPSAPVMVLAGMVYGPWLGTLYSVIGGVLGAFGTFWLGRTLGRARVARWAEHHGRLRKAMEFVEAHPALSVLIVQTVPVFPLNLMTYGFGATAIRMRTYLGLTALMLIPGAALYAGVGNLVPVIASRERLAAHAVIWVIAFGLLTAMLGFYAKRRAEFP